MRVSLPRLPGEWGEIRSLRPPQVSVGSFLLYVYSTD